MPSVELSDDEHGLCVLADNLPSLRALPDESVDLIYIDPPFNTGRAQTRSVLRTARDPDGDRVGFQGERYRTELVARTSFAGRVRRLPRASSSRGSWRPARVLEPTGTLYFHIDYREVHYCKVLLDGIFGRACFLNEIIWAYDYGARTQQAVAPQARQHPRLREGPGDYIFNRSTPWTASPTWRPGSSAPEKAARGKLPDRHLVAHDRPPTGREKLGLPDAEAARHPPSASSRPRRTPATSCSTSSRAAARPAPPARARPPLPARRRQPRRHRGDGSAASPKPRGCASSMRASPSRKTTRPCSRACLEHRTV